MKLTHTVKILIDEKELELTVRDLKNSEAKTLQKKHDKLKDTIAEMQVIQKQAKRLEGKLERLEVRTGESIGMEKMACLDKQDELIEQIEKLEDKAEKIDLSDIDDQLEGLYKQRIELACSGEAKDEILQVAKDYGYKRIWETIKEAVITNEKKS